MKIKDIGAGEPLNFIPGNSELKFPLELAFI